MTDDKTKTRADVLQINVHQRWETHGFAKELRYWTRAETGVGNRGQSALSRRWSHCDWGLRRRPHAHLAGNASPKRFPPIPAMVCA